MWSTIPTFQAGETTTSFLDETPELFEFTPRRDRATKLLTYLADVIVNGNPEVADKPRPGNHARRPHPAAHIRRRRPKARANCWTSSGPNGLPIGRASRTRLLITDTTFRDAHQSLMATRVRTYDMLRDRRLRRAHVCHNLYSLEMWGGATFDVAHALPATKIPGSVCSALREAIPEHLLPDAAARLECRRLHGIS